MARRALAAHVRLLRVARGMTQERLAAAAEIDVRHVQRIEASQGNPQLRTLCVLAEALGSTPDALLAADLDPAMEPGDPGA